MSMFFSISDDLFPLAESYRCLKPPTHACIREKRLSLPPAFLFTERHLKCVWFDPALRPDVLRAHNGDIVAVEQPGRWNLESGPDFLGAALLIGSEQRRVTGDVEIHITPEDWKRHGHGENPAYNDIVAHVTYFPGYLPSGILPRGTLQISLKEGLVSNPLFSFESIDVTAYPFALRARTTPCSAALSDWDPDRLTAFLEAAGEERLRQKAERMAFGIREKGHDQVLYEEIMSAMGYKNNRSPFRYLAEQLPLEMLREESRLDEMAAYSMLMGIAGLLPAQMNARWDKETRSFVRQLWNHWWKYQSKWSSRMLSRNVWVLSGLRPQNHPRRRLMTAAILFSGKTDLSHNLSSLTLEKPDQWMKKTMKVLQPQPCPPAYWNTRLSFSGKQLTSPVSLTGKRRAASMVSNVVIPFLAASGEPHAAHIELLRMLAPEEDNSIVRQTAHSLLGPDHNPSSYRTGLRQQGLIQIFHDFCLNDRSGCTSCPLPALLDQFMS